MNKFGLFIYLALSCYTIGSLNSQTFFEDSEGKTSIFLPAGGNLRINTADKSLKFAYYYNRSDKDWVIGIDVSGKSNNGFAPIISNEKLSPEANVNFNLGFKNVSTDNTTLSSYDYLNLRFGIGAANYKILNLTTNFEEQVYSESFNEINVGFSYNYYLNGNMIFGIYGGYDKTNNISNLFKLTVKESTEIAVNPTDNITRISEVEYTAWKGDFKSVNQFSLFFDYVYIPDFLDNRVATSVYSRSKFNDIRNQTNGGFGIYLNKENEPLKVVGGIIYEFQDLFDAKEEETSLGERGTLGIILGYYF